jgi:Rod binding domain-containing protein
MIQKIASAAPAGAPAQADPRREQLKTAAKAFEAVFVRQMIGSMRQAKLAEDDLMLGGSATDTFREMSDAKLADSMARKGSFGIAEMLLKQFDAAGGPRNERSSRAGAVGRHRLPDRHERDRRQCRQCGDAGYARRDVRLRESTNSGSRSPLYREELFFSGVEAASIGRAWDAYRAADSRYAASASGRSDARQQWLGAIETNLGTGPTAVGSRIGAFFNAGEALAATPSDRLARSAMLSTLSDAAGSIRDTAQALSRVSDGITAASTQEIDALNAELKALAEVNTALARRRRTAAPSPRSKTSATACSIPSPAGSISARPSATKAR